MHTRTRTHAHRHTAILVRNFPPFYRGWFDADVLCWRSMWATFQTYVPIGTCLRWEGRCQYATGGTGY